MTQPSATEAKLVDKLDNPQIANRKAAITAAVVAHNMTGSDSVNIGVLDNAMDALGAKINECIERFEDHGLSEDN